MLQRCAKEIMQIRYNLNRSFKSQCFGKTVICHFTKGMVEQLVGNSRCKKMIPKSPPMLTCFLFFCIIITTFKKPHLFWREIIFLFFYPSGLPFRVSDGLRRDLLPRLRLQLRLPPPRVEGGGGGGRGLIPGRGRVIRTLIAYHQGAG